MLAPTDKKMYPCPCCGQPVEFTRPLVDMTSNVAAWRGNLKLTRQEADLVMILSTRFNKVVFYDTIASELFGERDVCSKKTMQVVVCVLRKKLPHIGLQIKTVHDRGYCLVGEAITPLFAWQI